MKIVIFSGGTGSVQLQTGLADFFGADKVDYTIITNLADNGLSTGVCRRVMDGKIMGPSDLRKNQMLRAKLLQSVDLDLYKFLDWRITSDASSVKSTILQKLHSLTLEYSIKKILLSGIEGFFSRPSALDIDYDDFSVSNIIYSGLAKQHGYSLDVAGKLFEQVLNIPEDSVISNTDEPMYLVATTESLYEIMDEGDIVNWDNPLDKIASCHFIDNRGQKVLPVMSEKSLKKIAEADLIIFSTGTQWSSLIPTYISAGFDKAIRESKAAKYLIMNCTQDKDVKGVSGDDMIKLLSRYLPLDQMNILSATDGDESLVPTFSPVNVRIIKEKLCDRWEKKHDPQKLVYTLFKDYYSCFLDNKTQVFDYDDTIVARGEADPDTSLQNIKLIRSINSYHDYTLWISTGNSVKAFKKGFTEMPVLADGGVNQYWITESGDVMFKECLDSSFIFSKDETDKLIDIITECGIDVSKVQIRGKVMMSIKPINPEYRHSLVILLTSVLPEYSVKATGRTTIDITKPNMSKAIALDKIFYTQFTFVGDEGYEGGNDYDMAMCPRCRFLYIKSVKDTYMYLTVLNHIIKDSRELIEWN